MQHPAIVQEATSGQGGSAATGGNSYTFHNGLSKDSQTLVVVLSSFSLAVSICVLVVYLVGRASDRDRNDDKITAVEKRVMDAVYAAQQTGALAREDVRVLAAELNKRGIDISTAH